MRKFSKYYKLGTKTCFGIVLIVGLINIGLTCYGTFTTGDHEEIYFQYRNPLIAICSLGVFMGIIEHGKIAFTEAQKSIMQMISRHSFTHISVTYYFSGYCKGRIRTARCTGMDRDTAVYGWNFSL